MLLACAKVTPMKLRYPISSELFTFVHELNHAVEASLRRECGLSVVQYRALSCMRQAGEIEEAAIARIMAVSASQLSQALGKLVERDYAHYRRRRGPAKLWHLTGMGNEAIENADMVLIEACNQVFGPLGPELGAAIRAGSMLTNQRHGIVRIENGRFFEEHACFEAFLQAERYTKQSTKEMGFTQTEFRILFELLMGGPATKSALSKRMMIAPSVVTETCSALAGRGLLVVQEDKADKRAHLVALTEEGRSKTETVAELVDRRGYEDLRPSSAEERALYQRMADIVVTRS